MSRLVGTSEALVVKADGTAGLSPVANNCPQGSFVVDDFNGRTVAASNSGGFGPSTLGPSWSNGFLVGGLVSPSTTIGVSGGVGTISVTDSGGVGSSNWGTGLVFPVGLIACTRDEILSFRYTVTGGTAADTQVVIQLYDGLVRGGSNAYNFALNGSTPPSPTGTYSAQIVHSGYGPTYLSMVQIDATQSSWSDGDLSSSMAIVIGRTYQMDIWFSDAYSPSDGWVRLYTAGTTPPEWGVGPGFPGGFQFGANPNMTPRMPAINALSISLSVLSGGPPATLTVDQIDLTLL